MSTRIVGPLSATMIAAGAIGLLAAGPSAHAEAPPVTMVSSADYQQLRDNYVGDFAGVFSSAEATAISDSLRQGFQDHGRLLYLIFESDYQGTGTERAEQWFQQMSGDNVAIISVDVSSRAYGYHAGSEWSESELKDIVNAGLPALGDSNWAAGAQTMADTYASSGSLSGEEIGWLGGGAVAVVGAGGGLWYASKRRRKQEQRQQIEQARQFRSDDVDSFRSLDTEVLAELAEEELVSTDESIRRAHEELRLAKAEFGEIRTRQFTQALESSQRTLHEAFAIKSALDAGNFRGERRDGLVRIVTSCASADDILDARSEDFARMRNVLLNAPENLDRLTQRIVDLRTRLPRAEEQLEQLRSRYSASTLGSITDNVEMAEKHLSEAESTLDTARDRAQLPAGEQSDVVDLITGTEKLVDQADQLLAGVEHAETNIAGARAALPGLIEEVRAELRETEDLMRRSRSTGVRVDEQRVSSVTQQAEQAVAHAQEQGEADPLASHATLTEADGELDLLLETLRTTSRVGEELLRRLDSTLASADRLIQSTEDLVATRGRVIGARPRTLLAEAIQLRSRAQQLRGTNLRGAADTAVEAHRAADRAYRAAEDEISKYNDRHRSSGSTSGAFVAGMVINSLLSGGGGGGFSGGGGSFGGGGGGGSFGGGGRF
ncbi:TPM domain-containing protein [Corynebacterium sp. TAE3-ERU2]|uniref:TPM domain-containing protein n=1 Tax=Corynebacterium sp. TAE3-ERU2 TaxID=2849497 RepID=UPI001C46A84C|nr:TPM domain-containing protein [Corynebacterium sp. TAE3-ERU2]MBV7301398.1 TPM domain-containing protein [Corynebacterium sp. TAE3-ERU2]